MINSHTFRKKWGQNFLRDPNTINKIVNVLNVKYSDTIIEIGPGDGSLTDILVSKARKVYAIEIDPYLVEYLNKKRHENLVIYQQDILKYDIANFPSNIKIVGNLPYNISTPILFRFIENINWEKMVLMFQKELAERIISKEGNRLYGRISVMCQVYCNIRLEFNVSKNVFQPKPKINSTVLSFYPKKNIEFINPKIFSLFIKKSFLQRRKKLKNNLPEFYKKGLIDGWENMRPEEISPLEYVELYKSIYLGESN